MLIWSVTMAAPPPATPDDPQPPLTAAQKKAEYDRVRFYETLTPAQIKQRDIIPGWRPIAPKSDIEQRKRRIVPDEENPFFSVGTRRIAGQGLKPDELARLGEPSDPPPAFQGDTGARGAWWYEQVDAQGELTGLWMAIYTVGGYVEVQVMVGQLFMGPGDVERLRPGVEATVTALRSLKSTLSGQPPPPPLPRLSAAEKAAAYARLAVAEVLTPEQRAQRDVIPGWRPIPPLSDGQRAAVWLAPGVPNLHRIAAIGFEGSDILTQDDLKALGEASPSPPGFAARSWIAAGYWYAQLDDAGEPRGRWIVIGARGPVVCAMELTSVGLMQSGAEGWSESDDGPPAYVALRAVERALVGDRAPPTREERHERLRAWQVREEERTKSSPER